MTKHEPLPWFAFNVADYITDTMRLNTEAHGAYLLLMLDYYATGEACPNDDVQLAAVTKLPFAKWQSDVRPALERFFTVREGRWVHERIEREMLEASDKHARASARASAGGKARMQKLKQSRAESAAPSQETQVSSFESAASKPQASPEPSHELGQTQTHIYSLSTRDADAERQEEPSGLGTTISPDFQPDREILEHIGVQADAGTIALEIQKFIWHHREQSTFSHDWNASFQKWWARFIEHHAKPSDEVRKNRRKAPPRVEVDVKPDQIDWDRMLKRYKNNNSLWSHKLYGPAPGLPGCRVPREKLIEHGLITEEEKHDA